MEPRRSHRRSTRARSPALLEHESSHRPVLAVTLLGGLYLRLGESPLPPLESARAESLLAYLLLHRETPQPRQRLAFLLWPDSAESQARTNLRHVLHTLRRSLPDADRYLEVTPRTLRWTAEAPLRLDVVAFEEAVARAGRDEGDGTVAALREAVEIYSGDLLEGSYDEWILEPRERLREQYLEALERLARLLEARREPAQAIPYAERLLRLDPLREDTYRLLIRLHDARADRARALRVYHACAATLERELGVEPSAATRELYESLLPAREDIRAHDAHPHRGGNVLVGRTSERARLTELWRRSERGYAQMVLVTGEPGIGKSRLVDELRSWAAHRGAATAEARAYPAEGAIAYGGVATWLRSDALATRLLRLEHVHLAELARVLPELLDEVPGLAVPEPLSESEQRGRLFGALERAILAAGGPLLLIADDLQWCDVETLQFVHYVLRAGPDTRLLVAATVRHEDLDVRHPVSDLVAGLQAIGRVSEIALGRLSREETATLAERVARRRLSETEADRLYDDSEGNPLFIVEALQAEGDAATARGAETAGKVQAVIALRLAQLSEQAHELIGAAATIGREFTAQILASTSGADEQVFVRSLDELWRRGLVRARGPAAYDFSHGKIREAAYLALSPARTRHWHLRVAQALAHQADDVDGVAGEIAAHYERAGAADDAVAWYTRAADGAQRLHASADAARFLERALESACGLPESAARSELELRLLTALPAPLVAVEGYLSERVAEVHDRALGLARALGVKPEAPLARSVALASLARGNFEAAHAFGEQLRARARVDGDEVLWVESAYVLGITAYWQGRLERARRHFQDAIEGCRPEDRSVHLLQYAQDPEIVCLTRLAHTLWLLGRESDAERARRQGLELAESRGHQYSLAVAIVWSAMLALDQGDGDRLRGHAQALRSDHPAFAVPQIRIVGDALAGLLDVLDGRTKEGTELVQRVVDDARRNEPATPGFHAILMHILLETHAVAGDAEAGVEVADETLAMGRGTQLWEAETRRLRAEFLAAIGSPTEEVGAELTRALEVAQLQGARSFELRVRESRERMQAGTG